MKRNETKRNGTESEIEVEVEKEKLEKTRFSSRIRHLVARSEMKGALEGCLLEGALFKSIILCNFDSYRNG